MQHLPIFLNLTNRLCLIVGGGSVAARKAELLILSGAKVTVIAPELDQEMQLYLKDQKITWLQKTFSVDTSVQSFALIIAATDNQSINTLVSQKAQEANIPVNVADQPELCSFILPAIVDRNPITIAISTGGNSPVLARFLKSRLETLIPMAFGKLASLLGQFRQAVKQQFENVKQRKLFWESILNSPVTEMVLANNFKQAEAFLQKALSQTTILEQGEVYLIGAGPGDADLLTFRALRLLQQCDVIVYDRLVSQEVLNLARREAMRIYVGKKANHHTLAQEDISALLCKLAQEGKKVARLKGGDPFIFGRGGEEITLLAEHNIPFQVVPGITAASGCSAYSGIPLTHRDYAHSCRFITGHAKQGALDLDWGSLIAEKQTLVFYMGVKNLAAICNNLQAHGMPNTMPIAIIEKGTTQEQRVITGNLNTLPVLAKNQQIQSPSLIIVGEVVQLHASLQWFNAHPQTNTQLEAA